MFSNQRKLVGGAQSRKRRRSESVQDFNNIDGLERKKRKQIRSSRETHRRLLPVKYDGTLVSRTLAQPQAVPVGDSWFSTASEEPELEDSTQPPLVPSTTVELYAERLKRLSDLKNSICHLSIEILRDPQANVLLIKKLLDITENRSEVLVSTTAQKLATASLLEVFLDIIPQYKIRALTPGEKAEKARKETRQLRDYEEVLLRYYRRFLQHLERWVKAGLAATPDVRTAPASNDKRSKGLLGLQGFCRLLQQHSHFNFRSNILPLVVQFANSKLEDASLLCCDCLREIFRSDVTGDVSLEAVGHIAAIVSNRNQRVSSRVVDLFLELRISHGPIIYSEAERKKTKAVHDQKVATTRAFGSRKQRKQFKESIKLHRHLDELSVDQTVTRRTKLKTKIIDHVITSYFLLLRSNNYSLLPSVLKGLSKFAPLINLDFANDLLSTLNDLVEKPELKIVDKLHCIHTTFTILSQEGQAINVDPQNLYNVMFSLLKEMTCTSGLETDEIFVLLVSVLTMMIVDRRKQISQSRAAAFFKQICLMATQVFAPGAQMLVELAQRVLQAHPSLHRLFETDGDDCGMFLWDSSSLEHCNALAGDVYEMCLLQKFCDKNVQRQISSLLGQSNGQLINSHHCRRNGDNFLGIR